MEWTFSSATATAAMRSRAKFMSILRTFGKQESDFEAAELIFGELIGNVVTHAGADVAVRLEWTSENPALIIHDRRAFTPRFQLPEDPLQEHGRGLFIVHALAKSIDVHRSQSGTRVVAVLPVSLDVRTSN